LAAIVVLSAEETIVSCDCGHFCEARHGRRFACCVCLRLPKACRICDADEATQDGAAAAAAYMEPVSAAGERRD
jgi:hypothetical protein